MKRPKPKTKNRLFNWEKSWDSLYLDYLFGVGENPVEMRNYPDYRQMVHFCGWLISNYDDYLWKLGSYDGKSKLKANKHDFF